MVTMVIHNETDNTRQNTKSFWIGLAKKLLFWILDAGMANYYHF